MRNPISSLPTKLISQAAMVALLAGAGAACSNDFSRLAAPATTNSTGTARTGSAGDQAMPPTVVGRGEAVTTPVRTAAVTRSDLPPPAYTPSPAYTPPPPVTTGSTVRTAERSPAATTRSVTVQNGETVFSLARKHNVSASAILKANSLPVDTKVRVGQTLVIPGASSTATTATAVKVADARGTTGKPTATDATPVTRGAPPTTLGTLPSTRDGTPIAAAANRNAATGATAAATTATSTKVAALEPHKKPDAGAAATTAGAAKTEPVTTASVSRTETTDKPAATNIGVASTETADSPSADGQQFRWPVRGRIISGFGTKPNGEKNDGINLAVPEGTTVKAAEAGTVIYSGNEIAGYGNLILVRHAGGWVSAYAHTSSMMVKRGDAVKRGQTIANAGSSGNVTSPQLHFELRRGSNPVNPLDYLAGT